MKNLDLQLRVRCTNTNAGTTYVSDISLCIFPVNKYEIRIISRFPLLSQFRVKRKPAILRLVSTHNTLSERAQISCWSDIYEQMSEHTGKRTIKQKLWISCIVFVFFDFVTIYNELHIELQIGTVWTVGQHDKRWFSRAGTGQSALCYFQSSLQCTILVFLVRNCFNILKFESISKILVWGNSKNLT